MNEYSINEDFIKELLSETFKFDFSYDEKGYVGDKKLGAYINTCVDEIYKNLNNYIINLILNKHKYELEKLKNSPDPFICSLFHALCGSIYNYVIKKYNSQDIYFICCSNLVKNLLEQYQSLLSLMLSGMNVQCLIQSRAIYENYVILKFILENRELAQAYSDHSIISHYKLLHYYEYSICDEQLQKEYEDIILKYGVEFREDYGWTSAVILKRSDRKLLTIAKSVDIKYYNTFYKITSDVIHSSSLFVNNHHVELVPMEYINAITAELVSNGLIFYMKGLNIKEEHRILLNNILYALREEIFDEKKGL